MTTAIGGSGAADPVGAERLAAVIVTWNVAPLLGRCLRSLFDDQPGLCVVVVDNASSDGTVDLVRTEYPDVTLIANQDNVGFTRASNQALRLLGFAEQQAAPATDELGTPSPDSVLLLNPDTEVLPGAIRELADYLLRHPTVGAVGPLLRNPDGTVQGSRRAFPDVAVGIVESTPVEWHWRTNPVARRYRMESATAPAAGPVDWVTGAALMLRGKALAQVGLLDEGFFMYSEELDLCRRLGDCGWQVHFDPAAEIVHHEAQSSGQLPGLRPLWFHRSRVRYFRKHNGAVAAEAVRLGILGAFAAESGLEAAKWLMGHKRPLRRERLRSYAALLADGLLGEAVSGPDAPMEPRSC